MTARDRANFQHLNDASQLVTTYEKRRAGFIALALERNRRATPFVELARALKVAVEVCTAPAELITLDNLKLSVLTATGVSDKARKHLQESDRIAIIKEFVDTFLAPAGGQWREELVYRFLLTRGDTLGGAMRNLGGAIAEQKLIRAIIGALDLAEVHWSWQPRNGTEWIERPEDVASIELSLRRLSWTKEGRNRTLVLNAKNPLIKKSVDLTLINCVSNRWRNALMDHKACLALGELKGGIDPGGADEHWKTAGSALRRLRDEYSRPKLTPCLFFVGATIEKSMADEIWVDLESGSLSNAANLTDQDQVASVCRWLVGI